jgi:hypothetical protein
VHVFNPHVPRHSLVGFPDAARHAAVLTAGWRLHLTRLETAKTVGRVRRSRHPAQFPVSVSELFFLRRQPIGLE